VGWKLTQSGSCAIHPQDQESSEPRLRRRNPLLLEALKPVCRAMVASSEEGGVGWIISDPVMRMSNNHWHYSALLLR